MYIIVMLCNDDDKYYIDYIDEVFKDYKDAKHKMNRCVLSERDSLETDGTKVEIIRDIDKVWLELDGNIITAYEILKFS